MTDPLQRGLGDVATAFQLLTRLPLGPLGRLASPDQAAGAVWAYPVAGMAVGAIGALAYGLAQAVGLGALVSALLALAAMAAATGALHEDGLADTLDGFGGGHDADQILAIMRDSRTGAFGALGLIFSVGVRAAALAALEDLGAVAAALIVSGALSRASLPALAAILPPARADGMAASLGQPDAGPVWLGAGLSGLAAFVLQPAGLAILLIALAAAAAAFWGVLVKRRIGGQTGNILGATEQTVSMAALIALAAQATP